MALQVEQDGFASEELDAERAPEGELVLPAGVRVTTPKPEVRVQESPATTAEVVRVDLASHGRKKMIHVRARVARAEAGEKVEIDAERAYEPERQSGTDEERSVASRGGIDQNAEVKAGMELRFGWLETRVPGLGVTVDRRRTIAFASKITPK